MKALRNHLTNYSVQSPSGGTACRWLCRIVCFSSTSVVTLEQRLLPSLAHAVSVVAIAIAQLSLLRLPFLQLYTYHMSQSCRSTVGSSIHLGVSHTLLLGHISCPNPDCYTYTHPTCAATHLCIVTRTASEHTNGTSLNNQNRVCVCLRRSAFQA